MTKERINLTMPRDHQDHELIKKIFATPWLRPSMHGTKDKVFERHYIRVGWLTRYWDKSDKEEIDRRVAQFNEQSSEYKMEVFGYTDFEVDDDRYYEASFDCGFTKK